MLKNFKLDNIRHADAFLLFNNPYKVLYDEIDGFMILTENDFCLIGVETENAFNKIFSLIPDNVSLIAVHGDKFDGLIKDRFSPKHIQNCTQYVYTGNVLPLNTNLTIKPLTLDNLDFCAQNYHDNREYLSKLINKKLLYGAFIEDKQVAFIGRHENLTIGLLFVHPDYRRQGIGEVLETFIINLVVSENMYPVGHVVDGNNASHNLQQKFNFIKTDEKVIWYSI